MATRQWADVVGYEGLYSVSSDGKFRREAREDSLGKKYKPKEYKGQVNQDGYIRVSLAKDGKCVKKMLHRLVMEAFCPLLDYKGVEVNHKNLDKQDNRVENLEWVSHKKNMEHAKDEGALDNRSSRTAYVLKNETTGEVYYTTAEAAEKMGVHPSTIQEAYKKNHRVKGQYITVIGEVKKVFTDEGMVWVHQ